jgi:hypothetical protein
MGNVKPMIDMINGLPGQDSAAINVKVNSSKWLFLRGSIFCDDCNLKVSGVAATCPLRAGEELIIDYSTCNTKQLQLKYGVVPCQLQPHGNGVVDTIKCILPLDCKPYPTNVLRLRAVHSIFG